MTVLKLVVPPFAKRVLLPVRSAACDPADDRPDPAQRCPAETRAELLDAMTWFWREACWDDADHGNQQALRLLFQGDDTDQQLPINPPASFGRAESEQEAKAFPILGGMFSRFDETLQRGDLIAANSLRLNLVFPVGVQSARGFSSSLIAARPEVMLLAENHTSDGALQVRFFLLGVSIARLVGKICCT